MPKTSVMSALKQMRRQVFTTAEMAAACGTTLSNITQTLSHLRKQGVIVKVARGLWALDMGNQQVSQYSVIPFLLPRQRVYVSFVSALHLHGIIEQIPQAITLASLAHTKTIRTELGVFFVHRIAPSFFKGFDWYKGNGSFLVAEPEKALVDCFYLSARKKKQFAYFPELHFPKTFSLKRAQWWVKQIKDSKIRTHATKALLNLFKRKA